MRRSNDFSKSEYGRVLRTPHGRRGRRRTDRPRHPHLALLPRDGGRLPGGGLQPGAERDDRPGSDAGAQREDTEQRVGLLGRRLRGRRLPGPLVRLHQRAQSAGGRVAPGRVPPHRRAARRHCRGQCHGGVRRRDRRVCLRRSGCRGDAERAGICARRGRARPADRVDEPPRLPAGVRRRGARRVQRVGRGVYAAKQ